MFSVWLENFFLILNLWFLVPVFQEFAGMESYLHEKLSAVKAESYSFTPQTAADAQEGKIPLFWTQKYFEHS